MENLDLKVLQKDIDQIHQAADALMEKAQGIQAIECNAVRILASVYMLKINVSDLILD